MYKLFKVYLLTGSNLENKIEQLEKAANLINEKIGKIAKKSGYYETQAWGKTDQPDFVNQAIELKTTLKPKEVLQKILEIEKSMGRTRDTEKYAPRIIDIDIMFYENYIMNEKDLIIPHPRMHERNFALIPLMEIAPEQVHPLKNKMVEELYEDCTDPLEVVLL